MPNEGRGVRDIHLIVFYGGEPRFDQLNIATGDDLGPMGMAPVGALRSRAIAVFGRGQVGRTGKTENASF